MSSNHGKRNFIGPTWRRAYRLLYVLFLASCTTTSLHNPPQIPELANQPSIQIPDADLLAVTADMKEWVERQTASEDRKQSKAWLLTYAAMGPHNLDFDYQPWTTLTADQAFAQRRGNCLSFSSMFIAMAREAGLTAYYQEVEVPQNWSNVDDNLLVGRHINAVVLDDKSKITVDVSRRRGREIEHTRRVSDIEAQAEFYNNLGVDALLDKNIPLAYAYFHKGLELVPRLDFIWANLGLILRRNGQTADAILAYNVALQLQPEQSVALNNLQILYAEEGNLEAAEELRIRVEKTRQKNPYYMQHLAEIAIEEHRYKDAIKLAKKAIKMDEEEYRFYYTLARSQYLAGLTDVALASLDEAREMAPDLEARETLVLPAEEL